MSMLNDTQIKGRCIKPKFIVFKGTAEAVIEPQFISGDTTEETLKAWVENQNITLTGAKTVEEFLQHQPAEMINDEMMGNITAQFMSYTVIPDDEDISGKWHQMISPYNPDQVRKLELNGTEHPIPSYGQSSYGYDIRLGRDFKIMKPVTDETKDFVIKLLSANPTEGIMEDAKDVDFIIIPPHGFALGYSVEHVHLYRDLLGCCMAKSTIARSGLVAYVTPIEPEWRGHITIELSNPTDYPIEVPAGIGIMALIFFRAQQDCAVSYADRNGKYQNQPAAPVEATN